MTRKGALNPKERILNVLPSSKKKKKTAENSFYFKLQTKKKK